MKKPALTILAICLSLISFATPSRVELDTITTYNIDPITIRSNAKETMNLGQLPSATSSIGPRVIRARGLERIKGMSAMVPNLFIADYGSPLTTPIYIRGVGTRGSGQSVGIYVDNVPIMDKSTFDIQMLDLRSIGVLRGPQGTLYGRNAMGGVINIYTISPLDFQGTKIQLSAASHDNYSIHASHYMKFGQKVGLSVGGYFNTAGGYFTNEYNGQKVDKRMDAGGRVKLDWQISDRWRAGLKASYDWTDGGAFAYGLYDKKTGDVAPTNYNDKGSYARQSSNNSLHFQYKDDKVMFTSTTSYQWLNDDMLMDQDFTPEPIFTINQRQNMNAVSQEFAVRSVSNKNYQWSVGAFGFYNDLQTVGNVAFGSAGVKQILQKPFDQISASNPRAPKIRITDATIPNPGLYKTPTWGVALFHQSTFNNAFTEGLSFTVGLRVDYEKQYLDYNTSMAMNLKISMPSAGGRPPMEMPYKLDTTLTGNRSQGFFEYLPRVSIKYECTDNISTWVTASKGHRAGGYNVQMFSEVSQNALKEQAPMGQKPKPIDIDKTVSYAPEITWNYEVGTRGRFFDGIWTVELAGFYMSIRDLQLTQFIEGGSGRILTNAGLGESYGVEFSSHINPISGLMIDINYGYTHATFVDYNAGKDKNGVELNYAGNAIPYTPRHTFALGAIYDLKLPASWLDGLSFAASYGGAGPISWTEAGDVSQKFYGLLDAKVSIEKKNVCLELWGRNLTNAEYGAFYFESFNKSYLQLGRPLTFGANLVLTF
ncbi:MAG: TonB-dependent receptor [Mucinivorans sp.]